MRFQELDGVRGLASIVVLIHHALLVMPWAALPYFSTGESSTGMQRWVTYSPLHIFWVGPEAVILFFVLSGVVVSSPFLRADRRPTWREYYPSRLVRLYLPVAGSVVLAVLWYLAVSRETDGSDSAWIQSHDLPLDPAIVARTLFLLNGTDMFNSPLWSLQWEVWFSLLLPLYVLLARVRRLRVLNPVGALLVLLALDAIGIYRPLFYLVSFAVGVALSVYVEDLRDRRLPDWAGWLLLAFVVLAMTWRWTTLGLGIVALSRWWATAAVVGSVTLLVLAMCWEPGRRFFGSRALLWCGTLSFSLYLVHEPLIVSLALLAPSDLLWIVPIVGAAASVPLAMWFFRWIEAPSHRLSRRVRVAVRAVSDREREGVAPVSGPDGD